MTDPAAASAVPELNGTNWRQWFLRMENYLRIHNLWDVTAQERKFSRNENGEIKLEEKASYEMMHRARCLIINCVNSEYSGHITRCETANEVWSVLKNLYQQTGQQRETELRQKLNKAKKHHDQTIDQYMNNIVQIVDELRQVNVDLSEEEVAHAVLDGLPSSYHTVTVVLKHYHSKLTMAKVRESLTYEEAYIKKGQAMITQDKTKTEREKVICQYCKKPGHTLHNCYFFRADYPQKDKRNNKNSHKPPEKTMALMTTKNQTNSKEKQTWIIDSGASWHMTGTKSLMDVSTMEPYETDITIADGTQLTSTARGTITLLSNNWNAPSVKLEKVLYVPGLTSNLLSVNCMVERGATVNFKLGVCTIWHNQMKIEAKLNNNGNYCLQASAKIWHQRLGHVHPQRLKKLQLPYKMNETCDACMENKQSATKFKSKLYNYQPLDLLYMDVVGPVHPTTPGGQRYYLSVLDHSTKTAMTYLMTEKGETGKYAAAAINTLERKAGNQLKVKAIRTDQGQEFMGRKFADFLSERGITHEKTAGYAPQQNDAERLHRDIREHASSMLNETNLPKKYWGEAVRAYVHVRNRLPPSHGTDTRSPLELLTGTKPSIEHLRVFGCEAWVLKPEAKQNGKFEPRSERGIFIGYENSTTYRVLLSNRMVTSRNVRFVENRMGQYNWPTDEQEPHHHEEQLRDEPDQWEDSTDTSSEEETEEQPEQKHMVSKYNLRPNRQTKFTAFIADNLPDKFDGYHQAMKRPDKEMWQEAINSELESLSKMRTWELAELPKDKKAIGSKWIFRVKRDNQNNITKYKARLVALGCHQKPGSDYEEIYASVVSKTSLRIFLAAVNQMHLHLHQMDIETAFLNAKLEEEVYLKIPAGIQNNNETKVLKLNRSLYGLKQAPRAWNNDLTKTLKDLNFTCVEVDQNVLKCRAKEEECYLCFYVDDILIASKNQKLIQNVKKMIQDKYKATDMGEAKNFLGITIHRKQNTGILEMEQTNKVKEYLKEHQMSDCKPNKIPLSVPLTNEEEQETIDHGHYQKIIGQLQYLAGTTRPDITHAASVLARYNNCPKSIHWKALRGTLKYLKGTEELTLKYTKTNENPKEKLTVTIYSDADYAGDKDSRRSRTGYIVTVMGSLVSWQSKLQPTIATSTTEAEYQAAGAAIKEGLWIRNFLHQLLETKTVQVTINIDNQSTLRLLKNPQSVTKAKHIDVQHHFIRERAIRNEVILTYCQTEQMWADYLTKQLPSEKFNICIKNIGMSAGCTRLSGSVGKSPNELGFQPSTPNSINCGDAPNRDLPRTRDGENDEGNDDEEQRRPQPNTLKEP